MSEKPNQEHSMKVFKIIQKALIFFPKFDNRLKFARGISGKPVYRLGFSIQNIINSFVLQIFIEYPQNARCSHQQRYCFKQKNDS